ncbi:hypothetical protein APHAL10511_007721 [Amanita phalloides]|nr:hypothetical protein APHAL10511_007721 [Amanita phalloides]
MGDGLNSNLLFMLPHHRSPSPNPAQSTFRFNTRPPVAERPDTRLSQVTSDSSMNLIQRDVSPESHSDWPEYYWTADSPSQASANQKRTAVGNFFYGWRLVLFGSWVNILLALLPIAWVVSLTMKNYHDLVFAFCILALIPLVKLHDLSTTDLAIRIGGTKTGLVNASMSNVVEIVVAISALRKCELQVLQAAMVGSILSKLLLILGLCFFAGGMRFSEQGFDATATQIHASLLNISVGALLIPVAYHFTLGSASDDAAADQAQDILHMSHGVSIVLLIIYAAYLLFQLWSHTHLYHDNHNKTSNRLSVKMPLEKTGIFRAMKLPISSRSDRTEEVALSSNMEKNVSNESSPVNLTFPRRLYLSPQASTSEVTLTDRNSDLNARLTSVRLVGERGAPVQRCDTYNELRATSPYPRDRVSLAMEEDVGSSRTATPRSTVKEPQLSWPLTCILLVLVTVAVVVTADWLVGSLNGVSLRVSKPWIGLILLPVVSSIAECITAVNVSVRDQLTLSVSVAIGSALQTALFCLPCMVILAWITHKPLSLLMDPFQSLVLYLSVQTAGYVIADGKSNWLEGAILICLYVIVCVAFWFYPGIDLPSTLLTC